MLGDAKTESGLDWGARLVCGLRIMSSFTALGTELVDFLPELGPSTDRMGQRTQAEDDLGAVAFRAHAGGPKTLLDHGLAGGFGDAPEPVGRPSAR